MVDRQNQMLASLIERENKAAEEVAKMEAAKTEAEREERVGAEMALIIAEGE